MLLHILALGPLLYGLALEPHQHVTGSTNKRQVVDNNSQAASNYSSGRTRKAIVRTERPANAMTQKQIVNEDSRNPTNYSNRDLDSAHMANQTRSRFVRATQLSLIAEDDHAGVLLSSAAGDETASESLNYVPFADLDCNGGVCVNWTVAMKLTGGSADLGFNSVYWTNDDLLNSDTKPTDPGDAKYDAFLNVPFTKIRMCTSSDPTDASCITHDFGVEQSSAKDVFSAGYTATADLDRDAMISTFQGAGAKDCPMIKPGFNVDCGAANQARWGYCNNIPQQPCNDGGDTDASIGIGLSGQANGREMGAGYTCYFKANSCSGGPGESNAWLFVAKDVPINDCTSSGDTPAASDCRCTNTSDRPDCIAGQYCWGEPPSCEDDAQPVQPVTALSEGAGERCTFGSALAVALLLQVASVH